MDTENIVNMANLMYCHYYRIIDNNKLVDDILSICRFTLMMGNIPGFILFNQNNNNFYYRGYEPTN